MIIEKEVLTIGKLVEKKLTIPDYQRPYKWQWKNVERLLNDIEGHKNKNRYRIGTIVIHQDEENKLNIVDGQQRITTLALVFYALNNFFEEDEKQVEKINLDNFLAGLKYDHKTSKKNIKNNYDKIDDFIKNLGDNKEAFKNFLLEKCEVVYIVLDSIDEAFQFFDSQNARGKDLEGYDLLKAFHLRETGQNTEEEKKEVLKFVKEWEKASTDKDEESTNDKLKNIFDDLFAIRKYSSNEKTGKYKEKKTISQGFTKDEDDVNEFKGINYLKDDGNNYPYMRSYLMNDIFLKSNDNGWKEVYKIKTKQQEINYPFQITGHILNGKRFFEYVRFYIKLKEELDKKEKRDFDKPFATQLFKRVLLFYYDKFGDNGLKEAEEYCYAWVYILYKHLKSLRFRSIDNKGAFGKNGKDKDGIKLFQKIRNSLYHRQVICLEVKNRLESDWNLVLKNIDKEVNDKLFEQIKQN